MTSEPATLGTRIRRARERARLSQEELAKAVGASKRAVGDWENDRRKPRNRLGAVEEVLGVHLDENTPQEPDMPTRAELDDLRARIYEVLGDEKGSVIEAAMDAALANRTTRDRDASSAQSAAGRQRPRAS